MPGYVGARRADNEPRWKALLNAALNQPYPTVELKAAIKALERQHWSETHPEVGLITARNLKQHQSGEASAQTLNPAR